MKTKIQLLMLIIISISIPQISCKKFLEIDPPSNSLVPVTVFQNDDVATSTVLGIYSTMALSGPYSGDMRSISTVCGLTSDEYVGYSTALLPFYINQIPADNTVIISIWLSIYQRIYAANSIIEGLEVSSNITIPVKNELRGEALFIRAFNYFYLINLFGAVPMHLTTDININATISRTPISKIYEQIISDLKIAETLLNENYITTERIRPNRSAVDALLARVYLYLQDWENAEIYSSKVIDKSDLYGLVALDNVFLKNSREAIWQLMPTANTNTNDGNLYILTTSPTQVSLSADFAINSFEDNDLRKTNWVKSFTNATGAYYYPYKYKIKSSSTVSEYAMVLRLAEQYLIRAEARAKLNKLSTAIMDLDEIRNRAGLTLIKDTNPNTSQTNLIATIQHERKVELFSEWGHRWFDLKRTENATNILSLIKENWQPTDVLFPISKDEVSRNTKITQNDGY